jgi:DNA-binding response OmpR family regulator
MRAVIADDDRSTVAIVTNLLSRSQLEVAVANDGNAAWELLSTGTPPALAIIDWMMPGVDGLELCRRIRREPRLASTHVILLTGRRSQTDVIAGLDAGADDYIVKPFELEELRTRIHVGIRIATLQERMSAHLAEMQAARGVAQPAGANAPAGLQAKGGWLNLAKDAYERSRRYRRPLGGLIQAGNVLSRDAAPADSGKPNEDQDKTR